MRAEEVSELCRRGADTRVCRVETHLDPPCHRIASASLVGQAFSLRRASARRLRYAANFSGFAAGCLRTQSRRNTCELFEWSVGGLKGRLQARLPATQAGRRHATKGQSQEAAFQAAVSDTRRISRASPFLCRRTRSPRNMLLPVELRSTGQAEACPTQRRRDESRRGRHECPRHVRSNGFMVQMAKAGRPAEAGRRLNACPTNMANRGLK